MNPVVEWGATTAAGTGRPDRVALCMCVCGGGYAKSEPFHLMKKQNRRVLRSECASPLLQQLFPLSLTKLSMCPDHQIEAKTSSPEGLEFKKKNQYIKIIYGA